MAHPLVTEYMHARIDGALAQADAFRKVGHSGTLGRLRELTLQELILPLLPCTWGVGTGLVIDSFGHQARRTKRELSSGQEDIIIYSKHELPELWRHQEQLLVPIESCLGIIEVKSTLTNQAVKDSVTHAGRIARLKINRPFRESPSMRAAWNELRKTNVTLPEWPMVDPTAWREHKTKAMHLLYSVFSFRTSRRKSAPNKELRRFEKAAGKRKLHIHAACVPMVGSLMVERQKIADFPTKHLFDPTRSREEVTWFLAWLFDNMRLIELMRTEHLIPPSLMSYLGPGAYNSA